MIYIVSDTEVLKAINIALADIVFAPAFCLYFLITWR
jgi:hypothetical protein